MLRSQPFAALLLATTLLGFSAGTAGALPCQDEETRDAFANPHLLVTTAWLAEHGHDAGVVVVDARGAKDFEAEHVPGAVSIPTSATYDPALRGNIGSRELIAACLGAQGIAASTHVVIYDAGRSTAAARVFWTLEVYGHGRVSVVDGGFAKWRAEERETTGATAAVTPVEYAIGSEPGRRSTLDVILEDVEDEGVVMLDARSSREFEAGRIPAAVHIDWTRNYTADKAPVFKSPAKLLALYADQGVTPDKRVHAY